MIKGLIFDMDGTITMTESLHHRAYSAVFKRHSVADYTLQEEITKYAGSGARVIFTKVFEDRGIKITPEKLEKCIEMKKELYKKIVQESEIEVVSGVREFLERPEVRCLKRIIATGNSNLESVELMLKKAGLVQYFPLMISVIEVERPKPFADIFLEAAKRIRLKPSECIVLEDAINGVKAAKAAGIKCIALATTTPSEELKASGADIIINDYAEFPYKYLI